MGDSMYVSSGSLYTIPPPPPQGKWHCPHLQMSKLGQRNQPPEPGSHGWCMCELVLEDRSSSLCRRPASPLVNRLLRKHRHPKLPPSLSWCPHFYVQAAMVEGYGDTTWWLVFSGLAKAWERGWNELELLNPRQKCLEDYLAQPFMHAEVWQVEGTSSCGTPWK